MEAGPLVITPTANPRWILVSGTDTRRGFVCSCYEGYWYVNLERSRFPGTCMQGKQGCPSKNNAKHCMLQKSVEL